MEEGTHSLAILHDSEHRSVCPNPLHTSTTRSTTVYGDTQKRKAERPCQKLQSGGDPSEVYLNQLDIFGTTPVTRHHNYMDELRAYYSFIYPDEIKSQSPLFASNKMNLSGDWIESRG